MKHGFLKSAFSVALALSAVSAVSAVAQTIEQETTDVQILQAWSVTQPSIYFDLKACEGRDPLPSKPGYSPSDYVNKDCTKQALEKTRMPGANQDSPSVTPWIIPQVYNYGAIMARHGGGTIVEIRALVRRSVLESPVFSGIGFYALNKIFDGTHFIPKDKFHIVSAEDVTLAENGEKAVVLRFVLFMPATAGDSGTGWGMDSVQFKPFAQFDADGNTYRNWERYFGNYRIYRLRSAGGHHQDDSINREYTLLKK